MQKASPAFYVTLRFYFTCYSGADKRKDDAPVTIRSRTGKCGSVVVWLGRRLLAVQEMSGALIISKVSGVGRKGIPSIRAANRYLPNNLQPKPGCKDFHSA
jgi:hypothetical protein